MRAERTPFIVTLQRAALVLAAALLYGCSSSAGGADSDRDPLRFSWLAENGGTYWYVPSQFLPAYGWQTDAPQSPQQLQDQTVWHIERYENGYFFGPVVAQFDDFPVQCQYLIGSVTPEGHVYITFNSLSTVPTSSPSLTTGLGVLVRTDGEWTFSMQMASGSSDFQVTHWAYMFPCASNEPCWDELPAVGQSVQDFLANCDAD